MVGNIVDEKTHKLFIEKGAVEHSLDTEIDDTLILGEIYNYFGLEI